MRLSHEWQASTTQRRPIGVAFSRLGLFAAGADVRRQSEVREQVADHLVVVGRVEAGALRRVLGRLGPVDRDRLERLLERLVVVAIRAVVRDPDRDTSRLGEDRALGPFFALSVGFGPVFGPPSGAFVIAPSVAMNDQSVPTCSSYSNSPWRQIS